MKNKNTIARFLFAIAGLVLFLGNDLCSQSLEPLQHDHTRSATQTRDKGQAVASKTSGTQILSLPFFEDFSSSRSQPDPSKWVPGGGVFINNHFPIDPPSVGVSTFDGVNSRGRAYQINPNDVVGNTDSLTSLPIDLSSYQPSDSIYLSFYWQGAGLGEMPNASRGDSLVLELLDNNSNWVSAWSRGGRRMQSFRQSLIPIADVKYLHSSFQFRFRSISKLSGIFDIWNIDYILIDAGRTRVDTTYEDINAVKILGNLISSYSSIPIKHLSDASSDIYNPTAQFRITNLSSIALPIQDLLGHVREVYSGAPIKSLTQPTAPIVSPGYHTYTYQLDTPDNFSVLDSAEIETTLYLRSQSILNKKINDTVRMSTVFKDYYAYDDGTAEATFGINKRFSMTAYRFFSYTADTLFAVDIAFPQNAVNLQGQGFNLSIHQPLGNPISGPTVRNINYSNSRNGFITYYLDSGKSEIVNGEFFVVLEQFTDQRLNIGADFNNHANAQIFFSMSGNSWQNISDATGELSTLALSDSFSLMIRPKFGKSIIEPVGQRPGNGSGKTQKVPTYDVTIGPNPLSGNQLYVGGLYDKLEIYNMIGVHIATLKSPQSDESTVTLPELPHGIYIFRFTKGQAQVSKKVIKQP